MSSLLDKLIQNKSSIIYVALKLFDIEEKLKAERLERAVIRGVNAACNRGNRDQLDRKFTFVPFRDSVQQDQAATINTKDIYDNDLTYLNNSLLIIAYNDGLSKDEGLCFELGYAYATGVSIIIISTDFIDHRLVSDEIVPMDPILCVAPDLMVRHKEILRKHKTFRDNLVATREAVLSVVSQGVEEMFCKSPAQGRGTPQRAIREASQRELTAFIDIGGEQFEWQTNVAQLIADAASTGGGLRTIRPVRYTSSHHSYTDRARADLDNVALSDTVVTCSDSDECAPGTAFIQGMARGLDKTILLYNSKKGTLVGPSGYESSRNLMIDYSATETFDSLSSLLEHIKSVSHYG